jgi:hypothetical protein
MLIEQLDDAALTTHDDATRVDAARDDAARVALAAIENADDSPIFCVSPDAAYAKMSLAKRTPLNDDAVALGIKLLMPVPPPSLHECAVMPPLWLNPYTTGAPTDTRMLLAPICHNSHWTLAVIFHPRLTSCCVWYLDSLTLAMPEWLPHKIEELFGEHASIVRYGTPQQKGVYDCGLFVIEYMRRLLDAPPSDEEVRETTSKSSRRAARVRSHPGKPKWFSATHLQHSGMRDLLLRGLETSIN